LFSRFNEETALQTFANNLTEPRVLTGKQPL